jgi:serine/threonine protein kinase
MTRTIGSRYEVLDEVGSGAIGVLYKARDRSLKKVVAVKLLHPNQVTPRRMIRLQKEARLLSQLHHVNLVSVFDFAMDDDGAPYIVMEFVEGHNLIELVNANGPLSIPIALEVFKDICQGLRYAHEHSILHRDLKPSNIMMIGTETKPEAKIIDFGLATSEEDEAPEQRITADGAIVGSPLYISPEQAQNKSTDRRSDIYSLGCLMYFALTGTPPFRGDTSNATVMMQLNDKPPTLKSRLPNVDIPDELETIIATALKKAPEERFQSVEALLAALENVSVVLNERQLKAKLETQQKEADTTDSAEPEKRPALAGPLRLAFVGAIIVLLSSIPLMVMKLMDADKQDDSVSEALQQHSMAQSQIEFDTGKENFEIFESAGMSVFKSAYLPYYAGMISWFRALGGIDDSRTPALLNKYPMATFMRFLHKDITGIGFKDFQNRAFRGLDFSACAIDKPGLETISHIKSLELLVLNKSANVKDECLPVLKNLRNLKYLALRFNPLTKASVKTLASLSTLRGLDFTGVQAFDDDALKEIMALKNLSSIGIGRTKISRAAIPLLTKRYELKGLDASGMNLTDADLEYLLNEPLIVLNLRENNEITNASIEKLASIQSIRHIIVASCRNVQQAGLVKISLKHPAVNFHIDSDVIQNGKYLAKDNVAPYRANIAY